jgi:hypothetical protein
MKQRSTHPACHIQDSWQHTRTAAWVLGTCTDCNADMLTDGAFRVDRDLYINRSKVRLMLTCCCPHQVHAHVRPELRIQQNQNVMAMRHLQEEE